MHAILTNKRRTHVQSNYTNTKQKAWFRRFLCHPARKRSGSILQPRTHTGDSLHEKTMISTQLVSVIEPCTQVNSAFYPTGAGESSTSLPGWGSGGVHSPVTDGRQVTLCDPVWQMKLRSSEMGCL